MALYLHPTGAVGPLPFRLRMPDGSTRTDPASFTSAEIASAGFAGPLPGKPPYDAATHQPPEWREGAWIVDPLADSVIRANSRRAERAALREQWDGLPHWIRGPYHPEFEAANRLLDDGDDDGAAALIEFAEPKAGFSDAQKAVFVVVQSEFSAAIEALP